MRTPGLRRIRLTRLLPRRRSNEERRPVEGLADAIERFNTIAFGNRYGVNVEKLDPRKPMRVVERSEGLRLYMFFSSEVDVFTSFTVPMPDVVYNWFYYTRLLYEYSKYSLMLLAEATPWALETVIPVGEEEKTTTPSGLPVPSMVPGRLAEKCRDNNPCIIVDYREHHKTDFKPVDRFLLFGFMIPGSRFYYALYYNTLGKVIA